MRSGDFLAWVCRDSYADRPVELAAMVFAGERQPFHVYAAWDGWVFDHSGWHRESDLIAVNADFERRAVRSVAITVSLAEFCKTYGHRMPYQYWYDPISRARRYVSRYTSPWNAVPGS
jgi:hypothetical protein